MDTTELVSIPNNETNLRNTSTECIEPISASEAYEKFFRNLISAYRNQPVLWDRNDPKYRNKEERDKALDEIYMACRDFPDANLEYVKAKIETIRTSFRREYQKVQASIKNAKSPVEIYKPTIWFYNDLLFLVEDEIDQDKELVQESLRGRKREKPNFVWNREDTLNLIDIIKEHPLLFNEYGSNFDKNLNSKKLEVFKTISEKLSEKSGKLYDFLEVKHKIYRLKNQRCRESKLFRKKGIPPRFWCYDELEFLDSAADKRNKKVKIEKSRNIKKEESNTENEEISQAMDSEEDSESSLEKRKKRRSKHSKKVKIKKEKKENFEQIEEVTLDKDIFDVIGKHVTLKLREMTLEQKQYAENLINEVLYHGMMENLRWDTKIAL